MINVLISPAGTEIDHEIWLSLRYQKAVKLFLAGSDYDHHTRYNGEQNLRLQNVNGESGLSTLQAFFLLYDIHFIFPAHHAKVVVDAWHQVEISANFASSTANPGNLAHYKNQPHLRVQDIMSISPWDNVTEQIESWSVFIKSDRKKYAQGALKINDKSTLKIQLCDKHDLSMNADHRRPEYTADCFTHDKYDNVCYQHRLRKGIQTRLSADPFFLYEQHNAHTAVAHSATEHHLRRSWRQYARRQCMGSFFGKVVHFSHDDKTSWYIAPHTGTTSVRGHS